MKKVFVTCLSIILMFVIVPAIFLVGCDNTNKATVDIKMTTLYVGKLKDSTETDNTHFLYMIDENTIAFGGGYSSEIDGNLGSLSSIPDYCYNLIKLESGYLGINQAESNRHIVVEGLTDGQIKVIFFVDEDPTIDLFILSVK